MGVSPLLLKGVYMARRKSGRLHMRVDVDDRALWQASADELDMSLSMWLECVANKEAEARQRERTLRTIYPQKYASGAPGGYAEQDTGPRSRSNRERPGQAEPPTPDPLLA
jgi:hypothetical protein